MVSARILIRADSSFPNGDLMTNMQRREIISAGWLSIRKNCASKLLAAGVTVLLTLAAQPTIADSRVETGSGVRVENVRVSAGDIGADAQIKFLIFNEMQTPLHLMGISSAVAKESRLEIEISSGKHVTTEVLTIPANETLNFETFHQRVFLSQLTRKLVPGQELAIKFHFLEGDVDTVAHVH